MLCRASGCSLHGGDGSAQGYILMEMRCLATPLAKLITSMDYRLNGNISLTVTLCNAISLTTHLILGCNSPPRTITNKVVSWDSEQEKERRATEQISHLALSARRNEKAGRGVAEGRSWDLPWARRGDGARGLWGIPKWGRRISARPCCYYRAGILVSSSILFCVNGEDGAG